MKDWKAREEAAAKHSEKIKKTTGGVGTDKTNASRAAGPELPGISPPSPPPIVAPKDGHVEDQKPAESSKDTASAEKFSGSPDASMDKTSAEQFSGTVASKDTAHYKVFKKHLVSYCEEK